MLIPTGLTKYQQLSEKLALLGTEDLKISADEAASFITNAILIAEKLGDDPTAKIQSLVHQGGGWSDYLGRAILTALEAALKAGVMMGTAMPEACDKALEAVE